MTEKRQVYKCTVCGNMVTVLHSGAGRLVCCNKPMELTPENSVDTVREKHIPVLEKTPAGFTVSVGSTPHPMEDDHYIEWVELIGDDKSYYQFMAPGEAPQTRFCVFPGTVTARAYCNKHGLWKG